MIHVHNQYSFQKRKQICDFTTSRINIFSTHLETHSSIQDVASSGYEISNGYPSQFPVTLRERPINIFWNGKWWLLDSIILLFCQK